MYRKYFFIYWVNFSGGNMSVYTPEHFEPFKLSKLSKHSKHSEPVKRVEQVESVRLSRLLYELVLKIELEELGRGKGVMN